MLSRTRLVGVDVGGTFTDVVAIDSGQLMTLKVPTDAGASERSVLRGAKEVGVSGARVFNLASTAGLNAIITRSLPKVAFLTTRGHRDILERGRLWRPFEALTDSAWRRAFGDTDRPLVPRYLRRGIQERLTPDGDVLVALDEGQARQELEILQRCSVEGIAICLLHAWVNPVHELRLRELARDVLGDIPCSISSEVSPLAREYPRASTTVVDLLMKLKYTEYTARLEDGLHELGFEGEFNYADCAAMLMPASYAIERPYRLVVGGPAAGTVASAHFGSVIGKANLLCGDVGGTSCDISVVLGGQPWVNTTFEVEWDLIVSALSTEIVTLGAGGGSVVTVGRAGELRVGPDSAGADPGPACYGRGGTRPTLTDAALLIGILAPGRFLGGQMPLDPGQAIAAFEGLDTSLTLSERISYAWRIGLHNIAEGLQDITIRRGIDPRDFSLVAFGAAGPMTLPNLLDMLHLQSVIVPPNPGAFSALGLLSSDQVYSQTRTLYGVLHPHAAPKIADLFDTMECELLNRAAVSRDEVQVVRTFDGRLLGQGFETPFIPIPEGRIDAGTIARMVAAFHDEYEKRNGTRFETFPVEGVIYRLQLIVPSAKVSYPTIAARSGDAIPVAGEVTLRHLQDGTRATCYERSALRATDHIAGPAIIWEEMSTTFIPHGRNATVGDFGEIVVA
jgi:N-methylhydantoinase A